MTLENGIEVRMPRLMHMQGATRARPFGALLAGSTVETMTRLLALDAKIRDSIRSKSPTRPDPDSAGRQAVGRLAAAWGQVYVIHYIRNPFVRRGKRFGSECMM